MSHKSYVITSQEKGKDFFDYRIVRKITNKKYDNYCTLRTVCLLMYNFISGEQILEEIEVLNSIMRRPPDKGLDITQLCCALYRLGFNYSYINKKNFLAEKHLFIDKKIVLYLKNCANDGHISYFQNGCIDYNYVIIIKSWNKLQFLRSYEKHKGYLRKKKNQQQETLP